MTEEVAAVMTSSVELAPTPEAPSVARRLVRDVCGSGTRQLCEDAQLVVTELVANAVRHARTPVKVRVGRLDHGLRFEVADCSQRPVRPRPAAPYDENGRGLMLVDALATRWRVEAEPEGKRIVAEL